METTYRTKRGGVAERLIFRGASRKDSCGYHAHAKNGIRELKGAYFVPLCRRWGGELGALTALDG